MYQTSDVPDPARENGFYLQLATLMNCLKGYIPEQSQQLLEDSLPDLREALIYDGAKINHLQLAQST